MVTPTIAQLAQHVTDLAGSFQIRLIVQPGMPPEHAGAGHIIVVCGECEQKNAIRRRGNARCGRCKAPLGHHSTCHCIMIAPVTDETAYAVALHELGHILHPTGRVNETDGSPTMRRINEVATLRDMRLQLLEERSAWEWAQHHALDWTVAMQHTMDLSLASYFAFARKLGLNPDGTPAWRHK